MQSILERTQGHPNFQALSFFLNQIAFMSNTYLIQERVHYVEKQKTEKTGAIRRSHRQNCPYLFFNINAIC